MNQSSDIHKTIVPNEVMFSEITALLAEGKTVTFHAKGNSMYPFIIENRDCIVLEHCSHIRKGDIVLAHLPEGPYVLHRIRSLDGENVTLMGDGNLRATEQCRRKDIIGKVKYLIRDGKQTDCDADAERRKAYIWQQLLPIRRYLLKICRIINKTKTSK